MAVVFFYFKAESQQSKVVLRFFAENVSHCIIQNEAISNVIEITPTNLSAASVNATTQTKGTLPFDIALSAPTAKPHCGLRLDSLL